MTRNSINNPLFIPKLYWITLTDSLLSEKRSQGNVKEILSGQTPTGGHFSCPSLCFKERLSAKPLKSTHFFIKKDFALILVLKMRVFGTRKWPIDVGGVMVI